MKNVKSIQFDSIEAALEELNAQDKGRYFLCVCPECEQDEAFIYKNNPTFIQCNRENECGERMILQFKEMKSMHEVRQERMLKVYPLLTLEQINTLDWAKRLFKHLQQNFISETLDDGYRGLSKKVTGKFIVDFHNESTVQFLFSKTTSLLSKDYSENKWMCKRNLVFPIYGEDDTLDRILLRSSIDPNIEPKEIQLIMNPSKDTRDFFVDIPEHAQNIVISEAILDALSFREIDEAVGIIALTGASKTRQVEKYLVGNKNLFVNKNILLAMDDDKAGIKAAKKLIEVIQQNGIGKSLNIFDYSSSQSKDANELLQKNRNEFEKMYQKSLGYVSKQKNRKQVYEIER